MISLCKGGFPFRGKCRAIAFFWNTNIQAERMCLTAHISKESDRKKSIMRHFPLNGNPPLPAVFNLNLDPDPYLNMKPTKTSELHIYLEYELGCWKWSQRWRKLKAIVISTSVSVPCAEIWIFYVNSIQCNCRAGDWNWRTIALASLFCLDEWLKFLLQIYMELTDWNLQRTINCAVWMGLNITI